MQREGDGSQVSERNLSISVDEMLHLCVQVATAGHFVHLTVVCKK